MDDTPQNVDAQKALGIAQASYPDQDFDPYRFRNCSIQVQEHGPHEYAPYAIIEPIGAVIKWSHCCSNDRKDAAARAEGIASANLIANSLQAYLSLSAAAGALLDAVDALGAVVQRVMGVEGQDARQARSVRGALPHIKQLADDLRSHLKVAEPLIYTLDWVRFVGVVQPRLPGVDYQVRLRASADGNEYASQAIATFSADGRWFLRFGMAEIDITEDVTHFAECPPGPDDEPTKRRVIQFGLQATSDGEPA